MRGPMGNSPPVVKDFAAPEDAAPCRRGHAVAALSPPSVRRNPLSRAATSRAARCSPIHTGNVHATAAGLVARAPTHLWRCGPAWALAESEGSMHARIHIPVAVLFVLLA